jgi:hypothetical protein
MTENIERTKIKNATFALAKKFPTLWQKIQEIQREEEELAEKRTTARTIVILEDRLSLLNEFHKVDLEQLARPAWKKLKTSMRPLSMLSRDVTRQVLASPCAHI